VGVVVGSGGLGRIMRPKAGGGQASFFTIVTAETVEQAFALNRQRFPAEQGYSYDIVDVEDPTDLDDAPARARAERTAVRVPPW
jgi:hypothetical protein